MRSLFLLLPVVVLAAACPSWTAPPTSPGAPAGAGCSASWECASGLACECGVCAAPSGQPATCIELDDACGEVPSDCFEACGDLTVVGTAACVNGRETCSAVEGVLESQCDGDTCWGEREPGELCVDGEYECEFGRSPATGLCYTFDCEQGETGTCVVACGDGSSPTDQVCLAGEWRCESGVSADECGQCVGTPPSCFLSCDDLTTVGGAACNATTLEWSCSHIVQNGTPATVATECCLDDVVIEDTEDLGALAGATCVLGTLAIGTGTATTVSLPDLALVTRDVFVASASLVEVHLPALERVGRTLQVESNPLLTTFEAPSLVSVGTGFQFVENPQLPTCDIVDILTRVEADGAVPVVSIVDNAACGDGGVTDDDAGSSDGDGGPEDAGTAVDGGESDGG